MNIFKYKTDKTFVKFFNCDSFDIAPKIPNESIDMVCTDIPYGETSKEGRMMLHKDGVKLSSNIMASYDVFKDKAEFDNFVIRFLKHAYRLLKKSGSMYVWMGREYAGYFIRLAESITNRLDDSDKDGSGFYSHNVIIWEKTNPGFSQFKSEWLSAYEACVYMTKDFKKPLVWNWQGHDIMQNVWTIGNAFKKETEHPNEKPIECFSRPILSNTNPGDVIWDPFAGSGSCLRACEVTGRSIIASEIKSDYFKQACKRLGKPTNVGNSAESLLDDMFA